MRKLLKTITALLLAVMIVMPLHIHAGSDVYISDTYGVLSDDQLQELSDRAREISDRYHFGVYAHILYDEASYDDIWTYIENYYEQEYLGYGDTRDGILFLITQSSRGGSYDIYIPAVSNQSYFTIDGLEAIQDEAEDGLFEHDYYRAVSDYLDETEHFLAYYNTHDYPWSEQSSGAVYYEPETGRAISGISIALGILIPLIIAIAVVAFNASKHRTKHERHDAHEYIPENGELRLRTHTDMYLYRTQSRVKVHHENSSGGGGGFTSSSGGMHSGGGHF
ncbi:MAG: TPM domain-containing protein [Bulleidia sp.]